MTTNRTGANLDAGVAATLARAAPAVGRGPRGRRAGRSPWSSTRSARELLVLGNLTRDQLDRYGEVRSVGDRWRARRARPTPTCTSSRTCPIRTWCGPRRRPAPPGSTSARTGAATPPRARRAARCSSGATDGSYSCACGFASPATDAPARRRHAAPRRDHACRSSSPCPDGGTVLNAALAVTAAATTSGSTRSAAAAAAAAVDDRRRAATRRATSPTDGRARVLLAKNPAGWSEVLRWLAAPRPRRGPRGERARRRRPGHRRGCGTCRSSCCAAARSPLAASAPRRRGAPRLRRRRARRRARPARGRGARRRRRGRLVPRTRSSPRSPAARPWRGVRGARRPRVPRAARHLRRPRERGRARPAVPLARHRRGARRGRGRRRRSPTRSTCTSSAAARTTRRRSPRRGMRESAAAIDRARAGGAVVFAVCAGFQLIGHQLPDGRRRGARRARPRRHRAPSAGVAPAHRRGGRGSRARDRAPAA